MTEAVDIYSMAMIFFSLIAGEVPFREEADLLAAGGRPTIDSSWHQGYVEASMLQNCISRDLAFDLLHHTHVAPCVSCLPRSEP